MFSSWPENSLIIRNVSAAADGQKDATAAVSGDSALVNNSEQTEELHEETQR